MLKTVMPKKAEFDIHLRNTASALILVDAIRVLSLNTVNNTNPDEVYSAQLSIQSICAVLSRRLSESADFLEECAAAFQADDRTARLSAEGNAVAAE